MNDSTVMKSLLFDFYGELLTDKQREYFDLHYNEDLSLQEIAEQCGISRQGVWDNIRRAEAAMLQIEEKTGLVRRFSETKAMLARLSQELDELCSITDGRSKELAESISRDISRIERSI